MVVIQNLITVNT
ncbi:hypothetical protein FWK35_00017135 [Aphis craccivora]|uniref:Uncharacterized protein n=1 Tax=Aphis craccivora TaxID=307492 RepID=A0A6G0YLW2_APHCR|nr:hypothetical protein FWK35_00017135 [Aphis craccivora]